MLTTVFNLSATDERITGVTTLQCDTLIPIEAIGFSSADRLCAHNFSQTCRGILVPLLLLLILI